jgi:hypothetical protein
MRREAEVEEATMLKRIALLGAMAALIIVKPSNAVAQGWDGWGGGITVNVRVPFPRRDFCCDDRRFFSRRDFCCDDRFRRRVFFDEERRDFCCDDRFRRRVFFDDDRRDFCCDDRRFFPRPFARPPYYYGDRFAPYAYNWNAGYTDAGY